MQDDRADLPQLHVVHTSHHYRCTRIKKYLLYGGGHHNPTGRPRYLHFFVAMTGGVTGIKMVCVVSIA
jgi:hypothetical protein